VLTPPTPPTVPGRCPLCARGCSCPPDGPGCSHYGCWGRWPTRDCPGVQAEEAAYAEACRQRRAQEARLLSRRARWRAGLTLPTILFR
jgi:hypothetical protein